MAAHGTFDQQARLEVGLQHQAPFDFGGWPEDDSKPEASLQTLKSEMSSPHATQQSAYRLRWSSNNMTYHRVSRDSCKHSAAIRSGPVGLSNMYRDGLAQLDAAMILYDAFYR
jgi:hypothetical protein